MALLVLGLPLTVLPLTGDTPPPSDPAVVINGDQGGPFTPSTFTFGVVNVAAVGSYWSVTQAPSWLDLEMTSGYLAPGEHISLTATVNDQALALPPGTHTEDFTIHFEAQPGDFNGDQKVDTLDVSIFESCISGAAIKCTPECAGADLDFDEDVDQDDYGILQRCFSGSNLADRNCK
ncbi:MAG TPA: hypothetical protein PKG54_14005 [Phycisphaerae bacterium]|jgi:hypothetical protein|nr:hypothetical protein [Phycisphaerae bacterium]HOB75626.1 hypothetical protein [Phycisphaerae bacterium]HOJ56299.1 hypothetical protein [Phycisphaerae bacterium]HOL28200.1 hypothetical protein [Phycisphaerae bacterium]HPP22446.1 hypothetical protein [Phycisphaerae bacterium]